VYYKQHQVGIRRTDFSVESEVSIELKAVVELEDVYFFTSNKLPRSIQHWSELTSQFRFKKCAV